MITFELTSGDQVITYLGNIYPRVKEATKKSITASLIELTAFVKANKLSGQVLKNQTGRLRRSIHASNVTEAGGLISGTVGTNVEYAAVHEYGFSGAVTVKEHMRMIKQAFGKPIKNPHEIAVRSHGRKVNLPEKSFLRSALKELAPGFIAKLQMDVSRAVK